MPMGLLEAGRPVRSARVALAVIAVTRWGMVRGRGWVYKQVST